MIDFDPLGIGTAMTFFLFAAIMFFYLWMGKPKKRMKDLLTWGVIITAVLGIATSGWLVATAEPTEATLITPTDMTVDVSESLTHVVQVSGDPYGYIVEMSFNDTSDAFVSQTQYFEATIVVGGLDGRSTTGTVESIGEYSSISATWDTRYIVERNADGTFQVTWTDSDSNDFNYECAIPRLSDMNTDSVTVNITADDVTVAGMAENDKAVVVLNVAGQDITITFEKETVTT